MSWLTEDFVHPQRVELPTDHHLRPIRESDVEIDYLAVVGSRERLWATFGEMWGWPPADMSDEADRKDLARHEAESLAHVTFNYAVLNRDETEQPERAVSGSRRRALGRHHLRCCRHATRSAVAPLARRR